MGRIFSIAQNTFREAIRQKLLYGLVFFTVLLIFASFFLGQLSIADTAVKIVKDMGLASIFFMGVFIALSMGISLVFREIDRKTIYTILSKPVSRFEFLVGKFFGLMVTVGVQLFLMTLLLFLLLKTYPEPLDWNLWKAVILIYMELCVLISITLLFSSYSSSFMSSMFCFSFLILGHLADDLVGVLDEKMKILERKKLLTPFQDVMYEFFKNAAKIFNLDHFVINAKVVHGVPIPWMNVLYAVMYAACFVIIFLIIANYLFSKKDLK